MAGRESLLVLLLVLLLSAENSERTRKSKGMRTMKEK